MLYILKLLKKILFGDYTVVDVNGCYCCSNPSVVKERIMLKQQGNNIKVEVCNICQMALKKDKKANILHFKIGDKEVHWSNHAGYEADSNYYILNRKKLRVIK